MKNKYFLSVIVPIFNEINRLHYLNNIFHYLRRKKFSFEVIIIDDGSQDKSLEKLRSFRRKKKFSLIHYQKNRGKGYAIKTGMLKAKGKYRLFLDLDQSTPIEEFEKSIPYLKKYDVIIASRRQKGSKILIKQSFLRESLGRVFTLISQIVLQVNISDFTCGFKVFSAKAAEKIFSQLTVNRWGFDTEALFIAQLDNLKIKEITIVWKNDPLTKVNLSLDILNSLRELFLIRINYLLGKYN